MMHNDVVLFDLAEETDWKGILRECAGRKSGAFGGFDIPFGEDFISSIWSAILDDFEEHSRDVPARFKDAMEHGLTLIFDRFEQDCAEEGRAPAAELLLMLFREEIEELSVLRGAEPEAVRLPDVAELIADLRLLDAAAPELDAMEELPLGWIEGIEQEEE